MLVKHMLQRRLVVLAAAKARPATTAVGGIFQASSPRSPALTNASPVAFQSMASYSSSGTVCTNTSPNSKTVHSNPLHVFRHECMSRNFCDDDGSRRLGVHWVLSVAANGESSDGQMPPNLRTVGIQRISDEGVDFCIKKGSDLADRVNENADGVPLSILHLQGRYVAGETAEQWRGDGVCYAIPLDGILPSLPTATITSMVGSKRMEKEAADRNDKDDAESTDRSPLKGKAHATEVMQRARLELENDSISFEEQDESIQAIRFVPYRLECMIGGPDSIMWDRWEWNRPTPQEVDASESNWKHGEWSEPTDLLAH